VRDKAFAVPDFNGKAAATDAAALGNAALTNLMESGTNGPATIIGNSRQNLGNLECWGVGGFWSGGGVVSKLAQPVKRISAAKKQGYSDSEGR
jgi:hypothetical protein